MLCIKTITVLVQSTMHETAEQAYVKELEEQVAAMTSLIAALHFTVTGGAFQSIKFSREELEHMAGTKVEIFAIDGGGADVVLTNDCDTCS